MALQKVECLFTFAGGSLSRRWRHWLFFLRDQEGTDPTFEWVDLCELVQLLTSSIYCQQSAHWLLARFLVLVSQ